MRGDQMKWTTRELEQLRIMKSQGLPEAVIAERLNRSENSVHVKWQRVCANKEKLHQQKLRAYAKRKIKRAAERAEMRANIKLTRVSQNVIQIPEEVIADWRLRGSLSHMSTTAELCGDPLPGYSALDRR